MPSEFLEAQGVRTHVEIYTAMTERGTALLDTAKVSIPAALDAVEQRANVVSGLQGELHSVMDPETGAQLDDLLVLGSGSTFVVSRRVAVDPQTGVALDLLDIGGLI